MPSAWTLLVELVAVLVLVDARRDIATCSCDCCEVERRREEELGEEADRKDGIFTDHFECAYSQTPLFSSSSPRCDSLCEQDASDTLLTATEVPEMDTQRFCFFECKPLPSHHQDPKIGGLCGPLSQSDRSELRDESGNAREAEGHFVVSHKRFNHQMAAVGLSSDHQMTAIDLSGFVAPSPAPGPTPSLAPAPGQAPGPTPQNLVLMPGPAPAPDPAPAPGPTPPTYPLSPGPSPTNAPVPSPDAASAPGPTPSAGPPVPSPQPQSASLPAPQPPPAVDLPAPAPTPASLKLAPSPIPQTQNNPSPAPSAAPRPSPAGLAQNGADLGTSAPKKAKPWDSIGPLPQEQSVKAVTWAQKAESSAKKAAAEAKKVQEMATKSGATMSSVMAKVGNAYTAMEETLEIEKKIHALKKSLWVRAKQTARDEIPIIIKEVEEKAKAKAEKDAKKKAKKFKKAMQAKAKTESAKAAKVYMDVMKGAGKTAAEYAKLADALVAQSATLQMNAGLSQGQANQFITIGDMPEAQKLMQQSRGDMNLAFSLNGQANDMYTKSSKITSQLPAYAGQAAMAAYHAQVLYDPKAVPPPPPLVLAQRYRHHGKRSLLSRARRQ